MIFEGIIHIIIKLQSGIWQKIIKPGGVDSGRCWRRVRAGEASSLLLVKLFNNSCLGKRNQKIQDQTN